MRKISEKRFLLLTLIVSVLLFLPSLFRFYTNDDFFHLLISKPSGVANFISIFDITKPHRGYLHFRPITTQVFYLVAWFSKLNPLPMHIILFLNYFIVIFLIYKLLKILDLPLGVIRTATFLYAVSATHFGRLYFLSTQEFGYALFTLLSLIYYIKQYKEKRAYYYWLSLGLYILSLLSKESAVITPLLIVLSTIYFEIRKKNSLIGSIKIYLIKDYKKLGLFILLTLVYLYFRYFSYGLASGDSYIWEFSPRVINTLFWYGAWSLNLPEMLVDFIGPGLRVNPNLFTFWSEKLIPIYTLLTIQAFLVITVVVYNYKKLNKSSSIYIFAFAWFTVSLIPYLFLPLHKFSFYTTVALFGVVLLIANLFENADRKIALVFCAVWLATSFFTQKLTEETNWITRGAATAERVNDYFQQNEKALSIYEKIAFVDTENDNDLPWKPSEIVKTSLSDENYFKVFYPGKFKVYYGNGGLPEDSYEIEARQFIGY